MQKDGQGAGAREKRKGGRGQLTASEWALDACAKAAKPAPCRRLLRAGGRLQRGVEAAHRLRALLRPAATHSTAAHCAMEDRAARLTALEAVAPGDKVAARPQARMLSRRAAKLVFGQPHLLHEKCCSICQ